MSSQQHVRWSFIATGIAVVIGVGCLPHSSQIYPPAIDPSRAGREDGLQPTQTPVFSFTTNYA